MVTKKKEAILATTRLLKRDVFFNTICRHLSESNIKYLDPETFFCRYMPLKYHEFKHLSSSEISIIREENFKSIDFFPLLRDILVFYYKPNYTIPVILFGYCWKILSHHPQTKEEVLIRNKAKDTITMILKEPKEPTRLFESGIEYLVVTSTLSELLDHIIVQMQFEFPPFSYVNPEIEKIDQYQKNNEKEEDNKSVCTFSSSSSSSSSPVTCSDSRADDLNLIEFFAQNLQNKHFTWRKFLKTKENYIRFSYLLSQLVIWICRIHVKKKKKITI